MIYFTAMDPLCRYRIYWIFLEIERRNDQNRLTFLEQILPLAPQISVRLPLVRVKIREEKGQKNLTETKVANNLGRRFPACTAPLDRANTNPWWSPLRRRALTTYVRYRRPLASTGLVRPSARPPHHARSIGRRDRPSSDPTRRPPGWRLRAGMRRNSPVSPSRQAHRPPAHRVAGCPALYALCAIDRSPEFVWGWICLLACCCWAWSLCHP